MPFPQQCAEKRKICGKKGFDKMRIRKIIMTATAAAMIPVTALASTSYTVQKGESYWIISQKFGTSLSSILSANNATEQTSLNVGEVIKVPSNTYKAQKGDTFYLIAQRCNVSLNALLAANGANSSTVLNIGDVVKIPEPSGNYIEHIAVKGDTYWLLSQKYGVSLSSILSLNNKTESSVLNIGDVVKIPASGATSTPSAPSQGTGNYITYSSYTVQKNDTLWDIAIKCGIPLQELLDANKLAESSYIYQGMKLTYPVHHIGVKPTPSDKYGELLDWFSEAQYVLPINADFKIVDLATGASFNARRTVGSGHADCEPLTAEDTAKMKKIWGGTFNWNKRSVLVIYGGRKIAASMAGMLHAGNESAPGGAWVSWRSDNYGAGINYDYVKGNNADGHFDLYFYNSIGHSSGTVNSTHQANVLKSAGK